MGETNLTNYLRLRKVPNGDMVMGKVLNDALDSIDEQLFAKERVILPHMAKLINPASVPVGPGFNGLLPPDYVELPFTSPFTLRKVRIAVPAALNLLGVNCNYALALSSDPTTPITTPVPVVAAAGADVTEELAVPVDIAVTDYLVLVAEAAAPGVGTVDVTVTIEGDLTV